MPAPAGTHDAAESNEPTLTGQAKRRRPLQQKRATAAHDQAKATAAFVQRMKKQPAGVYADPAPPTPPTAAPSTTSLTTAVSSAIGLSFLAELHAACDECNSFGQV